MVVAVLLGLSWLCSPLGALVLDFNHIRSSADLHGARKVRLLGRGARYRTADSWGVLFRL